MIYSRSLIEPTPMCRQLEGAGRGESRPPCATAATRDLSGSAGGTQLPLTPRGNCRQDDPQEVTDKLQIGEIPSCSVVRPIMTGTMFSPSFPSTSQKNNLNFDWGKLTPYSHPT